MGSSRYVSHEPPFAKLQSLFPGGVLPVMEAHKWLLVRGVNLHTLQKLDKAGYVKWVILTVAARHTRPPRSKG